MGCLPTNPRDKKHPGGVTLTPRGTQGASRCSSAPGKRSGIRALGFSSPGFLSSADSNPPSRPSSLHGRFRVPDGDEKLFWTFLGPGFAILVPPQVCTHPRARVQIHTAKAAGKAFPDPIGLIWDPQPGRGIYVGREGRIIK